jgi:hypothetical protein
LFTTDPAVGAEEVPGGGVALADETRDVIFRRRLPPQVMIIIILIINTLLVYFIRFTHLRADEGYK